MSHASYDIGFAPDEKFESDWPTYVSKSMDFWKGFHMYFKTQYRPHQVMFVTYESLVEEMLKNLKEILHFLGYDLPKDVGQCVSERKEGLFHRSKPIIDQYKYYNAEQKVVLKALKDEVYKKIGVKIKS